MTTQRTQHNVQQILVGIVLFAASGCAGGMQETRPFRAAGEWTYRLPTTASPINELAYGRGGSSARAIPVSSEAAPLLASADQTKPKQRAWHPRKQVAPTATPVVNTPEQPIQEQPSMATPAAQEPMQLAQADIAPEQRYGAREAESRQLEKFKGGDAVVIGISAGALVVVLLIVLLILLLR